MGTLEETTLGICVGTTDGATDGLTVGSCVGGFDGKSGGVCDVTFVGTLEGTPEPKGFSVDVVVADVVPVEETITFTAFSDTRTSHIRWQMMQKIQRSYLRV